MPKPAAQGSLGQSAALIRYLPFVPNFVDEWLGHHVTTSNDSSHVLRTGAADQLLPSRVWVNGPQRSRSIKLIAALLFLTYQARGVFLHGASL
jgi:hypothetical protein